jgi:hypothetical protein
MRRVTLSAVGVLGLLLAAPAGATVPFSYEWKTPRVAVTWSEENQGPAYLVARRQVAHWKRYADTLWARSPGAPRLVMEVSLRGYFEYPVGGKPAPVVRLRAGEQAAAVTAPLTERKVIQALLQVRGGEAPPVPLTDDSCPRLSPDGRWLALVTWRGSGPEVWLTRTDSGRGIRVRFPAGEKDLADGLVESEPAWSPDGRYLAWIQGGRAVLVEPEAGSARLVSAPEREPLELLWSPGPGSPLLVRYSDETFDVLDLQRSHALPLSALLKDAAPTGDFHWSPSGGKLLFRTQSRIVTTGLRRPGTLFSELETWMGRLLGQHSPAAPRYGANEDRLAVLSLPGRRLETFPLAPTPLASGSIESVGWSAAEDVLFVVKRQEEGFSLVRLPLRGRGPAVVVVDGSRPLASVGHRTAEDDSSSSGRRAAFLQGADLLLVSAEPSADISKPFPQNEVVALRLAPGPEGGYRGVESDAITEDEAGLRLVLESIEHTDGSPLKHRFPGGLLAAVPLKGAATTAVRARIAAGGVVDADIHSDADSPLAVLVLSHDGVGRIVAIAGGAGAPIETALSERLAAPSAVTPEDRPLPQVDPYDGLDALAPAREEATSVPLAVALGALGVLVLALVAVGMRGSRRRPR